MRTLTHAIADIRFTDELSSLICRCGEDIHHRDPNDLNFEFQNHREKHGEVRRGTTELLGNGNDSEFYRRQKEVNQPKGKSA